MDFPTNIPSELRKYVEPILASTYTVEHSWFQDLTKVASRDLKEEFENATTLSDRIACVSKGLPYWQFDRILSDLEENTKYPTLSKNANIANCFKSLGGTYGAEQPAEALCCFSLALNFSPTNTSSNLYVFCYEERSALLSSLDDNVLAEQDLQVAHGIRRSYSYMGQPAMPTNSELVKADLSLPDFVELRNIPYRGKGLIAKKHLPKGTIIMTENPFVHMTIDQLRWQTNLCDGCLTTTWNPVPCENCVFLKYCSVACRAEDNLNGHRYECPVLPFIHAMQIPDALHMCLKAICKGGPEVLYKYFYTYTPISQIPWIIFPDTLHRNWPQYGLLLNLKRMDESNEKFLDAWHAVALAHVLRKRSTFFEHPIIPSYERTKFEKFIAMIFLRHCNTFGPNMIEIQYLESESESEDGTDESQEAIQIGTGVYARVNMVNNSDGDAPAPNVEQKQLQRGKISLLAKVDIGIGEELILGSPGLSFALNSATIVEEEPRNEPAPGQVP